MTMDIADIFLLSAGIVILGLILNTNSFGKFKFYLDLPLYILMTKIVLSEKSK